MKFTPSVFVAICQLAIQPLWAESVAPASPQEEERPADAGGKLFEGVGVVNAREATSVFLKTAQASAAPLPQPQEVLRAMELANHHFLASWPTPGSNDGLPGNRPSNIWTRAVYFEGALALHRINKDPSLYNYALDWARFHEWGFRNGDATQNPDDQCAGQAYFELFQVEPEKTERLAHLRANLEKWAGNPQKLDYFTWIDALQMSMPNFVRLGLMDHKPAYLEKIFALYDYAKNTLGLYNPEDHLWWRDAKFKPPFKTPNGKQSYWSRGNGWVIAALARVLEALPKTDPHYAEYLKTFQEMAAALRPLQRQDGFWNASLGDPEDFGGPETTGTALFVYGMAWGIRKGHLPSEVYQPVIIKAWNSITSKALHPDGFLGFVQGTGSKPSDGQPVTYDSAPDFDDFGLGAFLLAGSEMYALGAAPQ